MVKVAIINQFSPRVCDYKSIEELEDKKYEIEFFTKSRFKSYYSSSKFKCYFYDDLLENQNYLFDLIESHAKKPFNYIVATHEFDIVLAAKIRELLGLSGQNIESAIGFRDKYIMKKYLEKVVSLPKYAEINDCIDLIEFTDNLRYPFVVKPRQGAGSIGVTIIQNKSELKDFISTPLSPNIMVETFTDGEMYHVDGLFKDSEILLYSVSKYFNDCLSFKTNTPLGSYIIDDSNPLSKKLYDATLKVLTKIPTPSHTIPFHAEFFVDGEQITFCEIASRVGGGLINDSFKLITNINLQETFVKSQIGIDYLNIIKSDKRTAWITIPPKEGELLSVSLYKDSWVEKVNFDETSIGRKYSGGDFSASALIAYLISGKNEEDLKSKISHIIKWQDENTIYKVK
ncbi:ATP-grasp domain protein [Streptococcus sp. AS20]|uniref:ATP-grasp domain-containing protein n=1 Tax=Streptococcus TaxID=1301 RepID=UPI00044DD8DF|nr:MULTISPECIES: ATP-grasp domain-containing protein [Streptococcus]EUB25207.1 ATP-grasp domain protein [Streptococcus sp. AS20]MDK6972068.1 ATP-grasp domain-containing protein [Streptococcus constellatus]OFP94047.1 carboxylate--amine ligase [Streptococcus sp. HMSC067A03]